MATTTSSLLGPVWANSWRRLVFMYVGPGKRRQWAARLGSPNRRPVPRFVVRLAGFVSILLSLLVFYLIGRISTYGVFWNEGHESGAWGGPTLAGAWFTHALIAAPVVALIVWALVPLTNLVIRGQR
jgi:hypothetical protein